MHMCVFLSGHRKKGRKEERKEESRIVPTHQTAVSVDLLLLWTQGALEEAGPHPLSPVPQTTQVMDMNTVPEKEKRQQQKLHTLPSITSLMFGLSG